MCTQAALCQSCNQVNVLRSHLLTCCIRHFGYKCTYPFWILTCLPPAVPHAPCNVYICTVYCVQQTADCQPGTCKPANGEEGSRAAEQNR
mmetsp:Transcript_34501/g.89373  ORF Transcript_34501/g.89373 Transcript_34501/m.89373 type:complete len:90 (-) Transcript_34501:320-589(-)